MENVGIHPSLLIAKQWQLMRSPNFFQAEISHEFSNFLIDNVIIFGSDFDH
jgi:hypothetical protein